MKLRPLVALSAACAISFAACEKQPTNTELDKKVDEAKAAAAEAGEKAKVAAEKAGEAAKEGAERLGEAAKEGAEKIGEAAKDAAAKVKEAASEAVDKATDKAAPAPGGDGKKEQPKEETTPPSEPAPTPAEK